MRGRPKGTIKKESKKLKTFRLSVFEKEVVVKVLKLIRGKIEEFESNEYEFITENIYLEAKSTAIFDKDYNIVEFSNPKVLYTINTHSTYGTFISKCPIISSTAHTYIIKNINNGNNIYEIKINKNQIDNHSIYFTQYHIALANLLERNKSFILNLLLEIDNPVVNIQFLKILKSYGIYPALEYAAKLLDMKEIFEVKDYTTEI